MAKMGNTKKSRQVQRAKRHRRIRKKIQGTAERPRLVVFRSLKNIEGQLIDDDASKTLVGESMQHPFLYLGENVTCGVTLLNSMVDHGVLRFILSSTA